MDRHIRLIAKDLHRTDFISSNTKAEDYNYGPLTRLLVTFAFYNPHIGYSQGKTFFHSLKMIRSSFDFEE